MTKDKVEISFDRTENRFEEDGLPITDLRARKHWDDVGSADWTVGAYNRMVEMVVNPNNPKQ